MSKKYRNKMCVYCARRKSEVGDHVFARELFLESQRNNLPQVPTCQRCNGEKAVLEHYLATALPFAGQHRDAARMLAERVPRRLAKNAKLHRELATGMSEEWVFDDSGKPEKRLMLPFDARKIETLFAHIVRGLIYHHWSVYLPDGYMADSVLMREAGQQHWEKLLSHPGIGRRVKGDLGEGTFLYEGFQSATDPHTTGWQFRVYGGAQLAGDPDLPGEIASMIIGRSVRQQSDRETPRGKW